MAGHWRGSVNTKHKAKSVDPIAYFVNKVESTGGPDTPSALPSLLCPTGDFGGKATDNEPRSCDGHFKPGAGQAYFTHPPRDGGIPKKRSQKNSPTFSFSKSEKERHRSFKVVCTAQVRCLVTVKTPFLIKKLILVVF